MDPLESLAQWLSFEVLKLTPKTPLGEAAAFFLYDVPKVLILLAVMVYLVSYLRTYVTPQRIKKLLGKRSEGVGNILAALLGVPTPFCSCSAVPLFIGLIEAGVPLGVTFSFLISSPMVNEIAVALLFGLFGWKVALMYVVSGLLIAIIAGILIGRLNLESEVEEFVFKVQAKKLKESKMTTKERLDFCNCQTSDIVKNVVLYVILGIGVGAIIHGYAPTDFLAGIAGNDNPLAVPIVVLIGIPLYSNAAGTIPIVSALMDKGMALGTALAFLMSITRFRFPKW